MGVSIESSGGGRKKVDAELNLIPFIDLLSVCILFLLMTAVWVQISKMSAFSQPSGEAVVTTSDVSSISEKREDRDIDIVLRPNEIEVKLDDKSLGLIPLENLAAVFDQIQERLGPDNLNPKISLRAADEIVYEDVIFVLDLLFNREWTNVTVGGLN